MTTFSIYGVTGHEHMSMEKVFKKPLVEKLGAITTARAIDDMEHPDGAVQHDRQHRIAQAYRAVEQLPQSPSILVAEQVMMSPVATLTSDARITEALRLFQTKAFRHVPVISTSGTLVGIVSDRDILRYLAGLTESYQQQLPHTTRERVDQLMTPRVLTASIDTDVRYIARLFVEQHIGAMPITQEGALKGIVTRSDLLKAVMRHYFLELWA